MKDWWARRSEFTKFFLAPVGFVVFCTVFVATLPATSRWFHFVSPETASGINKQVERLGVYGDMFGMLNVVFSGLAFCAIYYTLRIQQKQYDTQLEELNMKKEMANIEVDEVKSSEPFADVVLGGDPNVAYRPTYPAVYARVALRNTARMPAKGCRAVLTSIKKQDQAGRFLVIPESRRPLRLLASTEEDDSPEDKTTQIPYKLVQYFNVCSIKEENGRLPFALLQVAHGLSKYRGLGQKIKTGGVYRFKIYVDSENSPPWFVSMSVNIGERLDDFRIVKVKSCREPDDSWDDDEDE